LDRHGGNAEKSLAAVTPIGSIREELKRLADPDVEASLAHVSIAPVAQTHDTTLTWTAGSSTLAGARFRVLRPHAKGGLGEVFVAHDEELDREVAFKEIQDRHADNPDSRGRFLLEAKVTGGLEHPGIVPVYGLGSYADGRPFYAMRFIKGDSLKEAIHRFHQANAAGQDSTDRTAELRNLLGRFIDVCNAIEYAHSRGVLHGHMTWAFVLPQFRSAKQAIARRAKAVRPNSAAVARDAPKRHAQQSPLALKAIRDVRLQFDCLDHGSAGAVSEERVHDAEHCVTEAADVTPRVAIGSRDFWNCRPTALHAPPLSSIPAAP
jgi:hypothetical protein